MKNLTETIFETRDQVNVNVCSLNRLASSLTAVGNPFLAEQLLTIASNLSESMDQLVESNNDRINTDLRGVQKATADIIKAIGGKVAHHE